MSIYHLIQWFLLSFCLNIIYMLVVDIWGHLEYDRILIVIFNR